MSKYLFGMSAMSRGSSPVPDHVAPAAQGSDIKPVLFFIAFMMMLFCLSATISTSTRRDRWQEAFGNSIMNRMSRLFLCGVSFLPGFGGPSACYFPFLGLLQPLAFCPFFIRIVIFAIRLFERGLTSVGLTISRMISIHATSASGPQSSIALFEWAVFRKRFPLGAFGTNLSRDTASYAVLVHNCPPNRKAPDKLLLVSRKKMPGAVKPRLSELSFCVTR